MANTVRCQREDWPVLRQLVRDGARLVEDGRGGATIGGGAIRLPARQVCRLCKAGLVERPALPLFCDLDGEGGTITARGRQLFDAYGFGSAS